MSVVARLYTKDSWFDNFLELESDSSVDVTNLPYDDLSSNTRAGLTIENGGIEFSFVFYGQFSGIAPGRTLAEVADANAGSTVTREEQYADGELLSVISYAQPQLAQVVLSIPENLTYLQQVYSGNDIVYAAPLAVRDEQPNFNGYAGNDRYYDFGASEYLDIFHGGDGIDTIIFDAPRANYTWYEGEIWDPVTDSQSDQIGITVQDSTGRDGRNQIFGVERIEFSDVNIALDLDGNAGKVAKLLGAVFGADAVSNQEYVAIGLSYLDGGMTYADLGALAMSVTGKTSSTDVCNLLWTNVIGSAPMAADIAPFKTMLDARQISVGGLVALAADTSYNTENIDLIGLAQSGLEYV